ncbi:hypothetical protein Ndes2437A_g05752 [Nannochloris sp. 'desiccata']
MVQITMHCRALQAPGSVKPRLTGRKMRVRRVEANNSSHDTNTPSLTSTPADVLHSRRRVTLLTGLAATIPLLTLSQNDITFAAEVATPAAAPQVQLDAITDRVYLEFGLCPEGVRNDRRLGDKSILCSDPEALGRVVIGLYGNAAPGPAPAQSLDGENIVFGVTLEGLDVISSISRVPTFQPPKGNGKAFNDLAKFIGDERASKTSAKWGKPLKAVLITGSGVL